MRLKKKRPRGKMRATTALEATKGGGLGSAAAGDGPAETVNDAAMG